MEKQFKWVVMGRTGEYSDANYHVVAVVNSEADAQDNFVLAAQREAAELRDDLMEALYDNGRMNKVRARATFDPRVDADYNGPTEYYYESAPVWENVP